MIILHLLKKGVKGDMDEKSYMSLKNAVESYCFYGKENACDGAPLNSSAPRRSVCPFYSGKCTQGCISKIKRTIKNKNKRR